MVKLAVESFDLLVICCVGLMLCWSSVLAAVGVPVLTAVSQTTRYRRYWHLAEGRSTTDVTLLYVVLEIGMTKYSRANPRGASSVQYF